MPTLKLLPFVLAAVLVPAASAAAPLESVFLKPVGASHVGGRITYRSVGAGTAVTARLTGVPRGATVSILLHQGTCRRHGASFALVRAGRLLFHRQPVSISTVADGAHVFVVVVSGHEAACAAIPGMD
jgi:hypothetical protein